MLLSCSKNGGKKAYIPLDFIPWKQKPSGGPGTLEKPNDKFYVEC